MPVTLAAATPKQEECARLLPLSMAHLKARCGMIAALANSRSVGMMYIPSTGEHLMAKPNRASDDLDRRLSTLMVDVQAGDRRAYGELLRACEPFIRRVGRRAGVTDDRLNDVVQETLLTLHNARQTFDPARSFLAWLSVIAQRRAIDIMRRQGRSDRREVYAPIAYEAHADSSSDTGRSWEHAGRIKILGDAIASLPEGQRDAVERLALREQSLAEAAAETGKTAGALKVNLHRALKALRLHLGGEDGHA